jgi:hypothetical protein
MYQGLSEDIRNRKILDRIVENDRSIEKTLVRNGYTFRSGKEDGSKKLLIQRLWIDTTPADGFFELMNIESNRSILKTICSLKSAFTQDDLAAKWPLKKVDALITELCNLRILSQRALGNFELANKEAKFGENLEWYVAELFKRKLFATSDWGVKIEEAPCGGDYDVLARLENQIVYVECKAKNPGAVKESELLNFLKRDEFLRPHISIFFIDSTDNVDPVEDSLNKIGRKIGEVKATHNIKNTFGKPPYVEGVSSNVRHFQHRLFLVNSKKPVLETFKLCLRHRHRTGELEQAFKGRFWLHEEFNKVEKWWPAR